MSDPETAETLLASIIDGMDQSALKPHAIQIGFLCMFWSRLELELTMFLSALMGSSDGRVTVIVLNNMGFREKVSAAMALGFHKKPSDDWFTDLQKTLNEIDNDLRPNRNRWVHDFYLQAGDDVVKFTTKSAVYREQARKFALKLLESQPTKPADIRDTTISVLVMMGRLQELRERLPASPELSGTPSPEPDRDQGQTPIAPTSSPII
jgi:hypothetical protein